jgi:hypothetical protein
VSSLAGILIGAALNGTDGALVCTSFVAEYFCVVQSFAEIIHLLLPDFAFVHLHLRSCLSFFRFALHRYVELAFHSSVSCAIGYCGTVCFTLNPFVDDCGSNIDDDQDEMFGICFQCISCRFLLLPCFLD